MILYQYEHSPFCIPIPRLFSALGQPLQTVNLPNGDPRQVIELTGGAYYQVPVLVDDEKGGRVIFETASDSQDVARYLDTHCAGGRLFPARLEGLQNLILSHLENEVEGTTFRLQDPFFVRSIPGVVERTMVIRHKERKFGRGCLEKWEGEKEALLEATVRVLTPYEQILAHSPFLLGGEPVYGDFLLFGMLGNLTYQGHYAIPDSLPALIAWEQRLREFRFR